MTMPRHPRPPSSRAFTLIELLVAIGLTAIILWGLLELYSSATRFASTMFTEAELCAGGRAVLDHFCRDLTGASTLSIGYLRIINGEDDPNIDAVQFVAPVGEGGQLLHVIYRVHPVTKTLIRGVKGPVEDNTIPTNLTDYTDSPLGVRVERFNVQYVDNGSSSGDPIDVQLNEATKDVTWRDDTPTDGTSSRLPCAIFIEIQVVDPKGRASITLSSGAYLAGGGL